MVKTFKYQMTRCQSGELLNPLMHPFVFMTLVIGISFIFFDQTTPVQAFVLYALTQGVGHTFLNLWGVVAIVTAVSHFFAFLIRGEIGQVLWQVAYLGGFYLWFWALILYATHWYLFQLLALAIPNLYFWIWYAIQRRRRVLGKRTAFV